MAKKTQHLWDENAPDPEEEKAQKQQQQKPNNKKSRKRNKKKNKNQENEQSSEYTKSVQIIEDAVNNQQQIANNQMADIESKMAKLSTNSRSPSSSPSKSILKNPQNPNFEQEQQALAASLDNSDNDSDDKDGLDSIYMRRGGNLNKARGPPPRKLTKQKKRGKKNSRGKNRRKGGRGGRDDEEDEDKEDDDEQEDEEEIEKFYEQQKKVKVPKAAVQVELQTKKGNKKVTVVRGFLEKSPEKEQRIKSEFMKKFATSVTITFQNQGSDKGPKQVVIMGDKRYDFMKYLSEKFPKAKKLLFYKSKKFGMTPALHPVMQIIMPPPGKKNQA